MLSSMFWMNSFTISLLYGRRQLLSSWYILRENLHVANFRYGWQDGFTPLINTSTMPPGQNPGPFNSLSAHSQQVFTGSGNPGTSPRALKSALEANGYTERGLIPFHPLFQTKTNLWFPLVVAPYSLIMDWSLYMCSKVRSYSKELGNTL